MGRELLFGASVCNIMVSAFARLSHFLLHFFEPIRTLQNLARAAAIRWADDAVTLHHVKDAGGAAVPEPQPALQRGCRGFAHLEDATNRILVHGILVALELLILVFRFPVIGWRSQQEAL